MNLNNLSKEELIIELSILRENEANLAAIFHVIDESVILISSDETILAINDTAAKRLNSTPALLKGQNVFALLPIDVVEHRRPFILQVKEIGETVIFQDQRNGKWLENRISPITDHSGKVTRMAIFARDITEKRESEAAIIAAEAIESDLLRKINDAQHTAKIGSWDWNLITNEVWWSDELYHIFDLDVDKFTPSVESNAKYVHPEDCEKYHEEANRVIQTKGELNYDLRIITAKGQLKHCNSRARIECDSAGNPNLLLGTFSDITERKLREEALSQALAEREKFFSIIAHDLRSPFNGLLGLTQVLAEELPTMRLDQIMNIVSMLRNSAKNVYSLVENLLEWSCMRRGITIFSPQEFFLSPNMKGFLHPVIEQANKKGIKITCNISENLLVFGDMNMVSSTIRNLATNAVKFTHKGGIVVISARTTIWNTVEICVKDNGIGMSDVMIDKIFYLHENTHRKGTNDEPSVVTK